MLLQKEKWPEVVICWSRGDDSSSRSVRSRESWDAIIKYVQSGTFQDEILMLRGDVRAVKKSSSIVKLDPILVNGILRVGGLLHYSSISSEARHPAILTQASLHLQPHSAAIPQNQWALRLRAHSLSYPARILDYSSKSLLASHYFLVLQLQKEAGFCLRAENVQFAWRQSKNRPHLPSAMSALSVSARSK